MSRLAEPSPSQGQQSQQQQQQEQSPTRSKLVQRLLDASASVPAFLEDLLRTQAVIVAGTEAACFTIERNEQEVAMRLICHIRPDDSDQETRQAAIRAFQDLMKRCVIEGKDGAIEVGSPDGGDSQYCLITILRSEGTIVAASAVITRCRDMDRAKQRLTMMQLVAGYFEVFSLRRYAESARAIAERHQHVLQFTSAVGMAEGFESAAMSLCNELATRTGATRVAIGWLKGRWVRVKALSHTEKFDKKQELIVQIEKVMEECFDQEEPVFFDPEGKSSQNVTRAAASLSRAQGGNIVWSMPLRRREDIVGVITLEFPPRHKLDEQAEGTISVAVDILAPQLYDRFQNDRYIITKVGLSIKNLVKIVTGPKHMGVKLLIVFAIAGITFISLYKPMYRVRAPFQLVALQKNYVTAPFEGILREVYFKPGQVVKKGQVMAQMEDHDRQMQLVDLKGQRNELKAQITKHLATPGKGAELNVAQAQLEEVEAKIGLLEFEINNAKVIAPFDCMILISPLYDRQNAPVKAGDELFQIAQVDPQRPNQIAVEAELLVSERDIQEVKQIFDRQQAGQEKREFNGELATTSYPNEDFKFNITRIVPMGQPREGENVFQVYASVQNPAPWMHPGLAGESRVNVEPRTVIWWWTHRLVDWLKLKLWI